MIKVFQGLTFFVSLMISTSAVAGALPEYSAAEAYQHIGETARLTGMVDCIGNGRRHTDVQIGGCLPECVLWVVVPNDAKGPELDSWKLLGLKIAVTGKIESSQGTPQITINSTKQIEAQSSIDPNYLATAHEKENKSDFDGAIADLDRAIQQTHAPGAYTEQARLKANKRDFTGAIRDYDELIARSSDTYAQARAAQYNDRAQLKIKNADFDGAIADADNAIRLNPRFPWHYSTRGQADEGKGDFAAAIRDYQMAIKTEPHNSIYKDMLRHAQAGASQKHQQSPNERETTPDSIAEAFVQAYSGTDVDALAALYADRVDHTNSGVISNAAIRKQAQEYFARWPMRGWSLIGPVKIISMGPSRQKIIFSASYDASNSQTNKYAAGVARETLIVAGDASGTMKIVSQKEELNKRNSSRSDEERSKASVGKMSDTEIREKVIGYWSSPRHGYYIAPNGIMYMCPRKYATTTNRWRVKNGKFYWDNIPNTIDTLTDKKFEGTSFILIRGTKEEVDPE